MMYREERIYPTKAEIKEGLAELGKSIKLERGLNAVQTLGKKRDKKAKK